MFHVHVQYIWLCIILLFLITFQKGVLCTSYEYMDSYDDLDNMKVEELNNPINTEDLPFTIDWKSELPHNIEVPKVDLHTLILDFGAVSFIDVSGMKHLKTVRSSDISIQHEASSFICFYPKCIFSCCCCITCIIEVLN